MENPDGTFACPICGKPYPHYHDPEDLAGIPRQLPKTAGEIADYAIRFANHPYTAVYDPHAVNVSKLIVAYGEQCRRAGAEAAADLAWRAMNDGVSLQGACDLIRALPSAAEAASPAAGWRTVASAPKDARVLGCIVGFQPLCAYFSAGRWQDDHGADYPITHWMPLPAPPIAAPSEEARAG